MINVINTIAQGRGVHQSKIQVVRLVTSTGTQNPLCNEEDIDNYLAKLKGQLIKLLGDNDGIIVS